MKKYSYNKEDLLEKPQRYSYTPFEGNAFLLDFFDNRFFFIQRLEKKLLDILRLNRTTTRRFLVLFQPLIDEYFHVFSQKVQNSLSIPNFFVFPNTQSIFTKQYHKEKPFNRINVKRILFSLLIFPNNEKKNRNYWLHAFVKKYEVTKKIQNIYSSHFLSLQSSKYKLLINYVLLSANLTIDFEKTNNYKFLNCSLKLNDLLTSKLNDLKYIHEVFLTLFSLLLERNILKKILLQKGISLK